MSNIPGPLLSVEPVVDRYKEAFAEHGAHSLRTIFIPKGRQDERFTALTAPMTRGGVRVLDFGCGLGHLKPFLDARFPDIDYEGVDVVDDFIDANRAAYPGSGFRLINSYLDVVEDYDFVFLSGVFNIRYTDDDQANQDYIEASLAHLFARTRVALSVDFMRADVDYIQRGACHQDPRRIYDFVYSRLTKRLAMNLSYLPYEFCITAYSAQAIERPANIYSAAG